MGGATSVGNVTVVAVIDDGVTHSSAGPPEPLHDFTATASTIVQPAVVIVTEFVPQVHETGGVEPPTEQPDGKHVPSGLLVMPDPEHPEAVTCKQRVTGVHPA
ncbi:MAG TPA: hypothetical protein PLV13_02855 [Ilumatobacteraceae bacterium]|nr:hypothetical protein [Ilumatobacteraceae bacterium]